MNWRRLALALAFAVLGGTFAHANGDHGHKGGFFNKYNDRRHNSSNHHFFNHHFHKVKLCHHAGDRHGVTIEISHRSVFYHLFHGDQLGSCPVSGSH